MPQEVVVVDSSGDPADQGGQPLPVKTAATSVKQPVDIQARLQAAIDSTTTALAASGAYVGSWIPCDQYQYILASMFSDVAGTLEIDFSNDGSNADMTVTQAYTAAATTNNRIVQQVLAPYCRLKVANGATGEATLRAYAWGQA